MEMTSRPFDPENDPPAIAALYDDASASIRHVIDFPWRLSSPAGESDRDVRLWWTAGGRLVGFAAWQASWATLDLAVRRDEDRGSVEAMMLDWAEQRFAQLDAERGHPLPYWVEAYVNDADRIAGLRGRGYVLEDAYRYVELARSLEAPLSVAELPAGFGIRSLRGSADVPACVEAHRAAFASAAMTVSWRARTLRMPPYLKHLDLLVEAPDGRVVGFCVGWLAPRRRAGQIEPIGVIPEFQGQAIGRALLVEMLRRFRDHGARTALIETDSLRSTALRAYESVGFRPSRVAIRLGRLLS